MKGLAVVENTKKIVQRKLEHLFGAKTRVTEIQQAYKIWHHYQNVGPVL
jgi:hypothetical protein